MLWIYLNARKLVDREVLLSLIANTIRSLWVRATTIDSGYLRRTKYRIVRKKGAKRHRGTEKGMGYTNGVPNLRERRWLFKYYQIRIRLRAGGLAILPILPISDRRFRNSTLFPRRVNIREIRSQFTLIDRSARIYRVLILPRCGWGWKRKEINIGEPDIERYKQITQVSDNPV